LGISDYFFTERLEDSWIVSQFPEIFGTFKGARLSLLWRGSRDGFDLSEFHQRCDYHQNTLTVILDQHGNIFGGFSEVAWWIYEEVDNQNDFVFTLSNDADVPPSKFEVSETIERDERSGPNFGVFTVCDGKVMMRETTWSSHTEVEIGEIEVFKVLQPDDWTPMFHKAPDMATHQFLPKEIEQLRIRISAL
jgi:hypothetical protein